MSSIAGDVSGLTKQQRELLALASSPGREQFAGRAARTFLYAAAYTIQGGTNNILRNIIATRGLGLPG
mgnify:CR=1 FL=1